MSALPIVSPLANAVEIDWYDQHDRIVVTPRSQQRFSVQKDHAIEALRLLKDRDRFAPQFDRVLERLGRWLKPRAAKINAAVVTLQDNALLFVVVRAEVPYDEELQDDLAELDFAIAQDADLDLVRLRTVVLPPVDGEALESFLDQRMVLQYRHGD